MAKTTSGDRKAGAPRDARKRAPAPADPPAVETMKAESVAPRPRAASNGARKPAAAPAPNGPDLRADLRDFVAARPSGWGHDDWVVFLDYLRGRGHDTADSDAIGLALERERLSASLEGVQGMGPRRTQALVERYDTLWSAKRADVDDLASVPGMNRALAEKVRQALQS
jgi:hypothetical protein